MQKDLWLRGSFFSSYFIRLVSPPAAILIGYKITYFAGGLSEA